MTEERAGRVGRSTPDSRRGFTLIELLVVVATIGVLGSVGKLPLPPGD